jgi:hypothetical protein
MGVKTVEEARALTEVRVGDRCLTCLAMTSAYLAMWMAAP